MAQVYNKTKAGGAMAGKLLDEINAAIPARTCNYVNYDDPNLKIEFDAALTGAEETTLDSTIASHTTTRKESLVSSLAYGSPIKSMHDPTPGLPSTPLSGDRHIATATANGWTKDRMYVYNGTAWDEYRIEEGCRVYAKDKNATYHLVASGWVALPTGTGRAAAQAKEIDFMSTSTLLATGAGVSIGGRHILIPEPSEIDPNADTLVGRWHVEADRSSAEVANVFLYDNEAAAKDAATASADISNTSGYQVFDSASDFTVVGGKSYRFCVDQPGSTTSFRGITLLLWAYKA